MREESPVSKKQWHWQPTSLDKPWQDVTYLQGPKTAFDDRLGIPEEEEEDIRRGRFRRFGTDRGDIKIRGFLPKPHRDGLRVFFPSSEVISIGNDRSLLPRLIHETLCWVEAPNNGGEMSITQEMQEMRPFPGRIAEFDGNSYTGIGWAQLRFDTVKVMKRREVTPCYPGPASASQPRRCTTTAPDPHMDTSPENENTPPNREDSNEERRPSDPS